MSKKIVSISLLVGFLLIRFTINAQSDYRPGYIIKKNKDTIFGEIDYRSESKMVHFCHFRTTNKTKIEFLPSDISAFRFIDSKFFVSKMVDGTFVFLEYLINAEVSIYYMFDKQKGERYFIDKKNSHFTEIPFEEGSRIIDNKRYNYKTSKHIGLLSYYLKDAPELKSKIKVIKKPGHDNLIKLAKNYHNIVCNDNKCLIYTKKKPLLKSSIELIGGIINIKDNKFFTGKYAQGGILLHFWAPRSTEKFYFRTGILISKVENSDGVNTNIYKFPLQLEYIYPNDEIQLRMAYGFSYYNSYPFLTSSLNIGFDVKLSKEVFMSFSSDIDFYTNMLIVPEKLYSYSLNLGVIYKY